MSEQYDSTKHYPIILETARAVGEIYITPILRALERAGVAHHWSATDNHPVGDQVDRDICRAWRELGYRNRS